MKVLAAIVLIWLVCLLIGAAFKILGSIIWVAILLSLIAAVWGYIDKKNE